MKKTSTTYLAIAFAAFSLFGIACSARELASSSSNDLSGSVGEEHACDAAEGYEVTGVNGFYPASTMPQSVGAYATQSGGQAYYFTAQGVPGPVYAVNAATSTRLFDENGALLTVGNRQSDGTLLWTVDGSTPLSCPDFPGGFSSSSSGWSGSSSSGWAH